MLCDSLHQVQCFNGAVDVRRRRRADAGARDRHLGAASMGPSMFVDGDGLEALAAVRHRVASMGPSTFVDGDGVAAERSQNLGELQWGRRCSSTETVWSVWPVQRPVLLQWGRRRSSTETRRRQLRRHAARLASMGPSMFVDGDGIQISGSCSNTLRPRDRAGGVYSTRTESGLTRSHRRDPSDSRELNSASGHPLDRRTRPLASRAPDSIRIIYSVVNAPPLSHQRPPRVRSMRRTRN